MAISILPPEPTLFQKAKLKKINGVLNINDIALLRWYPDADYQKIAELYAYDIADACMQGEINCFHAIRQHDWQWLCEHPEYKGIHDLPLINCDETKFYPGSEQYNNTDSIFCLVKEWSGDQEPRPSYKYNDKLSKLKRFYCNNYDSEVFKWHRFEYATGKRCYISAIEFKHWLEKTGNWPLPVGCLLLNWFDICPQTTSEKKPQPEALSDGAVNQDNNNAERPKLTKLKNNIKRIK